jgi:galactokinase
VFIDPDKITIGNIDLIAQTAAGAGALGARMTGGGFGGCVIALVRVDPVEAVGDAVREAVRFAGYNEPLIMRTHAAQGANEVTSAT